MIQLAENLKVPLDIATQTLLLVGKRGAGKSSTATRLAEQLSASKVHFAVLDPVDVWWGMRLSGTGKEGGVQAYVFGGRHADLPLEPGAGALMADVIVDHRVNVIMVTREFSNRDKARFVSAFADQLFRRNSEALHLFCEEAHEFAPERPFKGEEEMLGRMIRLQKLGRSSGIGMTCITQRPASLNKNITTQSEILIAHRIIGPQDRNAIDEWIKYHHEEERRREVLETLATLKTGEAWVWSPDFPEAYPIGLRRVSILQPETYDSRRTPKAGEHLEAVRPLIPVDLEKLRDKMQATIERAKAEDPRELRAKIVKLEQQLRAAPVNEEAIQKAVEVAVAHKEREASAMIQKIKALIGSIRHHTETMAQVCDEVNIFESGTMDSATPVKWTAPARPRNPPKAFLAVGENNHLPVGEHAILRALAMYSDGCKRDQLTVLTGYKRSSRDAYLARLKARGLVDFNGVSVFATDAGKAALGKDYEPLPLGKELRDYWLARLPEGERKVLEVLLDSGGNPVSRSVIDEATGYKRSSRDAYLSRLKSRRLIEEAGLGEVRASATLF